MHQKQKKHLKAIVMKNTELSLETIGTFISSDQSFSNIMDLVREFDLEITSVSLS